MQRLQQKMVVKNRCISFNDCRVMEYLGFSQKTKAYKTRLGTGDFVEIVSQPLAVIMKAEKI